MCPAHFVRGCDKGTSKKMVRGSLRQPIKGIFWGASANPIKFYYGRKDDPPINHDLCWKVCIPALDCFLLSCSSASFPSCPRSCLSLSLPIKSLDRHCLLYVTIKAEYSISTLSNAWATKRRLCTSSRAVREPRSIPFRRGSTTYTCHSTTRTGKTQATCTQFCEEWAI